MPTLVFVLKDGTEVESSYDAPYSVREQIDWEEHFAQSFTAIEQAFDAARAARGGERLDPARSLRTTWVLWFGWHRARPKVPARFDQFIEQLEDWRIENVEEPVPEDLADRGEKDDGSAETDGRLDPTETTEPSAPGP